MDAQQFFDSLYRTNVDADNQLVIWRFKPDGKITSSFHHTTESAAKAVAESGNGEAVYFGNTLRSPGVTTKSGVRLITHLWADADFKHFSSEEEAEKVLDGFELEPTLVTTTGGGFHLYWRLEDSLPATPETMVYVESIMERLFYRLGGLDSVQNMTRILRVPGTQNYKYTPPGNVRVVAANEEASYALDSFDSVLPELPKAAMPDRVDVDLTYLPPTEREIAELLSHLPPEGWDYRDYNAILMAVHSIFPDNRGVTLIQGWSPALDKRTGEDITAQKFDSYKSQGISIGTLYRLALDHGWKPKRGPRLKIVRNGATPQKARTEKYVPEWKKLLDEMQPVEPEELPFLIRQQYEYLLPVMEAFQGTDWPIALALAFFSSQFPRVKYENLNLSIWMLGLAKQGIGKSIGISEMADVYKRVAQQRELDMPLFSSGTTRGLENMFAGGEDKQVMGVIDEFSGFLKSVKGDYSSGLKESMNKIYDGQTFAHRKATESVEITRPYLSLVAATTPPAWRDNADRQDTQNGFLTRFMFSVPNVSNILPRFRFNEESRLDMVSLIVAKAQALARVNVAVPNTPFGGDPPVLREYVKKLGLNTGIISTVEDDASNEEELAWGRVVARVKKLAALLALAEEVPEVVGNTLLVHERHFSLAIRIAHRAAAFQLRSLELLGRTNDNAEAEKVLRILKDRGVKGKLKIGISKTDLMRYTHLNKRQLEPILDLLMEDGTIEESAPNVRPVLYTLGEEQ